MFLPNRFSSELRMNSPTSSHISAPSKLPMVTSKLFGVFRFVHAFPLLKSSDLRACLIVLTSSLGMVVYFVAHNASKNTFGLKSRKNPPPIPEIKAFEDDLVRMIEKIKSRKVNDDFMNTLKNDRRKIQSSKNVFVFADKTRNIYEISPAAYEKLLTENVTKTYRAEPDDTINDINNELKRIAHKLNIADRVEPMAQKPAFITLKDHKDDFENHTKCRLINPAKSELGKVSKAILDEINTNIRHHTAVNQWRNTDETIAWFRNIRDKNRHTFLSFDIVDFYPSILEELLDDGLSCATKYTTIPNELVKTIKHARRSLLFNNGKAWTKRNTPNSFDVTMGSFDGAEICELVGLFILNSLEKRFGKNIGLYRDDGLAALNTCSGRLADKARKDLIRIFKDFGLQITTHTNQKIVIFLDFLDDTLLVLLYICMYVCMYVYLQEIPQAENVIL